MAKTWIKVRSGILEPKHRRKLGSAWFLYLFILDRTNWDDGVIHEWIDESAAEELELPLVTLRQHRRRLEDEGYIKTIKRQHHLEITVNNWTNPKIKPQSDNQSVKKLTRSKPQSDNQSVKKLTRSKPQSVNQSDNQSSQNLTHVHLININTLTHVEQESDDSLIDDFISLSGTKYSPIGVVERNEWLTVLRNMRKSGVTGEMIKEACKKREVAHPKYILSDVCMMLNNKKVWEEVT